ncbi:uncharacterized protein LOC144146714 [Haemaphysalis longicornis]
MKHQKFVRTSKKQGTVDSFFINSNDESVEHAECLFSGFLVEHNLLLNVSGHVRLLLRKMFLKSEEQSRYEERVYYDLDKGGVQPGPWHGQDQHEQQQPFSAGVGNPRESAFMEKVIRNQAEILMEVRAIIRQRVEGGVNVPTLPEGCPHLPVNTTSAIRELNRYLGNREKLQEMAQYFSHMGGYDFKAAARTVLGMVIGQPVALSCSWAGSKGAKQAFGELDNIVSLVLVSIQPRYPDANKVTVAAVIKKWLYSAGDRDGGHTKRKTLDGMN